MVQENVGPLERSKICRDSLKPALPSLIGRETGLRHCCKPIAVVAMRIPQECHCQGRGRRTLHAESNDLLAVRVLTQLHLLQGTDRQGMLPGQMDEFPCS